jgi:hypothetical protein
MVKRTHLQRAHKDEVKNMLAETRLQVSHNKLAKDMQDKYYAPIGVLEAEQRRIKSDIKRMEKGL